jgi:hypothetical protein
LGIIIVMNYDIANKTTIPNLSNRNIRYINK